MRLRVAATSLLVAMMACGPAAESDRTAPPSDTASGPDAMVQDSDSATAADCGLGEASPFVLSGDGVAGIRIGMSIRELGSRCRIVSDSTDPHGNEGMPERRAIVALGADSAIVIVNADRVWRIELTSERFRTADSTGVGSVAGELRRDGGRLLTGDRGVFVSLPAHCGLSFRLEAIPVDRGGAWSDIPDATPVSLVLVTGCD